MASVRSKSDSADPSKRTSTSSSLGGRDKRISSIFSVFSQGSSRKGSESRASFASSAEPELTDVELRRGPPLSKTPNRQSNGSQYSTSQLQVPHYEPKHRPQAAIHSPSISSPTSSTCASRLDKYFPKQPMSPTISFPAIDTQTRVSSTTVPPQKFISQMSLSLALRTATIQMQLPVIRPAHSAQEPQSSKMKRFFGNSTKLPKSPSSYELAGRSTFALVHGAILRYHSEFGDDLRKDATPDSTHFLNGLSTVCVTDAIQGFKWVLEIKTLSKAGLIKSSIKRTKSSQKLAGKNVDLTRLPWGIVDGIQVWYMVFETAPSMTEWMTLLRATVLSIREKEANPEKLSPFGTPKSSYRRSVKGSGKRSKNPKSPQLSSPTSTLEESLPSSPSSSSRHSFGILSKRGSIAEEVYLKRLSGASADSTQPRRRQPSQQDIALTAFRISAFEDDLEGFVPPNTTPPESRTPPKKLEPEPTHSGHPALTPNLTHYTNKRASIISLQSRLSSLSSGPRTPLTHNTVSPTASPALPRSRRALRRTQSGESPNNNNSWKQHQNHPPPHPPPSCPLPSPPSVYVQGNCLHGNYMTTGQRESSVFDQHDSLILGISPVFEMETPKTYLENTPRLSSDPGFSPASMDGLISGTENMTIVVGAGRAGI